MDGQPTTNWDIPAFANCWRIFLVILLLAAVGSKRPAVGDIILDTSIGTVLFSGDADPNDDYVSSPRSLGFNASFFGQTRSSVYVSENGYLSFAPYTGGLTFFPSSLGTLNPRIAPLWEDYLFLENQPNRIIERVLAGVYYSVTWENFWTSFEVVLGQPPPPPTLRTAQVIWFGASTDIGGFQFQPNDFAFSYRSSTGNTNDFGNLYGTVGLDAGTGNKAAVPSGTMGGEFITLQDNGPLPWDDGRFLLFRVNPNTASYDVSVQQVSMTNASVPEPSSLLCAGLGGGLALYMKRRRSGPARAQRTGWVFRNGSDD